MRTMIHRLHKDTEPKGNQAGDPPMVFGMTKIIPLIYRHSVDYIRLQGLLKRVLFFWRAGA